MDNVDRTAVIKCGDFIISLVGLLICIPLLTAFVVACFLVRVHPFADKVAWVEMKYYLLFLNLKQ